jgi:hypothetical protein
MSQSGGAASPAHPANRALNLRFAATTAVLVCLAASFTIYADGQPRLALMWLCIGALAPGFVGDQSKAYGCTMHVVLIGLAFAPLAEVPGCRWSRRSAHFGRSALTTDRSTLAGMRCANRTRLFAFGLGCRAWLPG